METILNVKNTPSILFFIASKNYQVWNGAERFRLQQRHTATRTRMHTHIPLSLRSSLAPSPRATNPSSSTLSFNFLLLPFFSHSHHPPGPSLQPLLLFIFSFCFFLNFTLQPFFPSLQLLLYRSFIPARFISLWIKLFPLWRSLIPPTHPHTLPLSRVWMLCTHSNKERDLDRERGREREHPHLRPLTD